jgi:TolA-binding protein
VEVPFRGAGWVYLGESASKRGISYSTRRLESEGQTFVFRANETGAYELQFYRQDFIRDYIVNDLVTVLVEEAPQAASSFGAPMDRGVAVAEPRWPTASAALAGESEAGAGTTMGTLPAVSATPDTAGSSVAVAGAASSPVPPGAAPSAPAAAPGTAAAGSPLALPAETPEGEYLRRAREEYGADHVPQALAILDQFQARFPRGSDEAYWLYAQLYEKLGPARDISLALDYYRRLVNEYPQSSRHGDARRRIAYLERYYINIQ